MTEIKIQELQYKIGEFLSLLESGETLKLINEDKAIAIVQPLNRPKVGFKQPLNRILIKGNNIASKMIEEERNSN